jgi:uncharacterized protein (DUF885 family)
MGIYPDDVTRAAFLMHLWDGALALRLDAALNTGLLTRAQAIDTMVNVSGRPRWQAEVYADRHLTTNAQTVSYMLGYQMLIRLRSEARERLGTRFDIAAFHDAVLRDGPMPLPMLEQRLRAWIQAEARRAMSN